MAENVNEESKVCPIWGTPATYHGRDGSGSSIWESDRAGGCFLLDDLTPDFALNLKDEDPRFKASLTTWLVDQRREGTNPPKIDKGVMRLVKTCHPLSVEDKKDQILLHFNKISPCLGGKIKVLMNQEPKLKYTNFDFLCAITESIDLKEVYFLIDCLSEINFINVVLKDVIYISDEEDIEYPKRRGATFSITAKGYSYLANIEKKRVNSSQAFVAMWFGEEIKDVYPKGIKPAIENAGYTPLRIDQSQHIGKIDDEIIAQIRRSCFLVVDFTQGNDGARGGVYYEAGFAHGLGIPVIFTCRKDCLDKVHFDTRQYNSILWEKPEDLIESLSNRISAVIGDGPLKSLPS